MRKLAVITALLGATTLASAAPAAGQTVTPSSAHFPNVPLRTDSAPVRFTLTAGMAPYNPAGTIGVGENSYAQGTFKETNTCDVGGFGLSPGQSCFIDVVFAPYLPTPVNKSNVLYAAGMTLPLTGSVKTSGGGKKKGCKKGKKGAAAAKKKKCKKK
jgi:hypothetical protein